MSNNRNRRPRPAAQTMDAGPPAAAPADDAGAAFPQIDEYPDKPSIVWNRDLVFEQALAKMKISYRFDPRYQTARVDLAASLSNSARPSLDGGLDLEKVAQIKDRALSMMLCQWRLLLVCENPQFVQLETPTARPGMYLGGSHRGRAAADMGYPTVAAYVVAGGISASDARVLGVQHNMGEGTNVSDDDRLVVALDNIRRSGVTSPDFKKVAGALGIDQNRLSRAYLLATLRERMSAEGDLRVVGYNRLSDSVLVKLNPLVKYNSLFTALATGLASLEKPPGSDPVQEIVKAVLSQRAEDRAGYVERQIADLRRSSGRVLHEVSLSGGPMSHTAAAVRMSMSRFRRMIDHRAGSRIDLNEKVPDRAERLALAGELEHLCDYILTLCTRLK